MIAVHVVAVGGGKWKDSAVLQILDVKVGGTMPDMELSEVAECEEHIAPIRTDAGHRSTLAQGIAVDFHPGSAEATGLSVKRQAHDVVA